MTKTYNDIEAVTRLLEEKESDLELAARIGQGLLEQNKKLEIQNEALEDQFTEAVEKISQLRHELNMKDALLHSYTEDYEEFNSSSTDLPGPFTVGKGLAECEVLQKTVKKLQDENVELRKETEKLATETCDLEEKEVNLVSDCVRQLDEANRKIKRLQDDLNAKSDVCVAQQEENTNLMCKVITVETNYKRQVAENEDLMKQLKEMLTTQGQLTNEIMELEEKYNECLSLLSEKTEEVKSLKKKAKPSVIHQHYGTSPFFRAEGSLAMELEKSENEENLPTEYKREHRKKHITKVMETARAIRKSSKRRDGSPSSLSSLSQHSGHGDVGFVPNFHGVAHRSSIGLRGEGDGLAAEVERSSKDARTSVSDIENARNDDSSAGWQSDGCSQTDMFDSVAFRIGTRLGKPGLPGSNDLETALRKLALREANQINQTMLQEQDRENENFAFIVQSEGDTPTPCPTPDSYMSTESGSNMSDWSRLSAGPGNYLPGSFWMPEKLQIVKPMEGSLTLHQWQHLATPRLEGLFETRPGVQIKGEQPVELEEEIYSLSDYEEDDDLSFLQAKAEDSTAGTYTYTTSKVLHPSDQYVYLVNSSVSNTMATTISLETNGNSSTVTVTSSITTAVNSTATSVAQRPTTLAISSNASDHGTSTFSMSFNLAATLHERGIKEGMTMSRNTSKQRGKKDKRGLLSKMSSWISAPKRFSSITTETPSDNKSNITQSSIMYVPPSADALLSPTKLPTKPSESNTLGQHENAYLNLVEKVRELGLSGVIGKYKDDPVDVGLNTVIKIRRNRVTGAPTRASAHALLNSKNRGINDSMLLGNYPKYSKENVLMALGHLNKSTRELKYLSGRKVYDSDKDLSHVRLDSHNSSLTSDGLLKSENSSNARVQQTTASSNTKSSHATLSKDDNLNAEENSVAITQINRVMSSPSDKYQSFIQTKSNIDRTDREISESPVKGLGYAIAPPNFGNASIARDNVYKSAQIGYPKFATSKMSSDIKMENSVSVNVGTGTIHAPMVSASATGSYVHTSSVTTSSANSSKLFGILDSVKPRSSAVIGGLTSTPISKPKK